MTTRQQRFKSTKSENPGPGSYEVIPEFVKEWGYTGIRDKFFSSQFLTLQTQLRVSFLHFTYYLQFIFNM